MNESSDLALEALVHLRENMHPCQCMDLEQLGKPGMCMPCEDCNKAIDENFMKIVPGCRSKVSPRMVCGEMCQFLDCCRLLSRCMWCLAPIKYNTLCHECVIQAVEIYAPIFERHYPNVNFNVPADVVRKIPERKNTYRNYGWRVANRTYYWLMTKTCMRPHHYHESVVDLFRKRQEEQSCNCVGGDDPFDVDYWL